MKMKMKMNFELADCVQRNKEHPETFHIPSVDEKSLLGKGDYVKLCFETKSGGSERMWVEITEIEGNSFKGVLDNNPVVVNELTCGDELQFELKHIASIYV